MSAGWSSPLQANSDATEFNKLSFMVNQILGGIATTTLVKVVAVNNAGEVSPVGLVDVQPMVNQVDGEMKATAHGIIHDVPYVRIQGGANAVIIDPEVGDIGWCGFCSTDISVVASTKAVANPGSRRRFDWADGLYLGGVLNAAPTQYVRFTPDGIEVVSTTAVTLRAPTITLDGDVTVTGDLVVDGEATAGGVALSTHTHSGVTTGGGDTGPPV